MNNCLTNKGFLTTSCTYIPSLLCWKLETDNLSERCKSKFLRKIYGWKFPKPYCWKCTTTMKMLEFDWFHVAHPNETQSSIWWQTAVHCLQSNKGWIDMHRPNIVQSGHFVWGTFCGHDILLSGHEYPCNNFFNKIVIHTIQNIQSNGES